MTLEYYLGFQKKPQNGNRFGIKQERGYYPCRLVAIFDISERMLEFSRCEDEIEDDPSVTKYFRKNKLNIINNYGRII